MGDVAGIGPEIIVKALADPEIYEISRPLVIGSGQVIKCEVQSPKSKVRAKPIKNIKEAKFEYGIIDVLHLDNLNLKHLKKGKPNLHTARAAVEYIKKAAELAKQKKLDALVTAPINKEAINKAGFRFPGHTQLLAQLTHTKLYRMMFVARRLRTVLVTDHCPIKKVPLLLTRQRILATIKLTHQEAKRFGINKPRIAVCGLNPHAGEEGLFGPEESRIILPAIKDAQKTGIAVQGPFSADTVFYRAKNGEFDFVIAMFHDQGLIPLKTVAFEEGVNVTLGLPFVRTSVGHGTAYDIAGKGIANPQSMIAAIKLAVKLANRKASGVRSKA